MAYVRKQIRTWLAANLTGSAQAGPRVHGRRALPLAKGLDPTLLYSIKVERSQDISQGGTQGRTVELRVVACAKGDAEATEDVLDALGLFVEGKFSANPTLGGLAETYEYQSTEFSMTGEAEQTLCAAEMIFAVTLTTARTNPETTL